jgi:starvation-inducible DNA-binding protein
LLRQTLADEFVLYTKTRKYHWNVEGPHFHDLHKLFESQYESIDETIDEVAERIRSLRQDLVNANDKFGDAGNQDFFTGLLEDHEKAAWMLRSLLR